MSLEILKKELKNDKVRSLYLFYGPEDYLKKHYLSEIGKKVVNPEFKDMNSITIEGKTDPGRMLDCFESLPLFSDRKLVVLKDTGFFKPRKNDGVAKKTEGVGKKTDSAGKKADAASMLADYLQSIPPHLCVVFHEDDVDKRSRLYNTILKNGLVVEFIYQKPEELAKWVARILASSGKEISHAAAIKLVEGTDFGMDEVLCEARKLTDYIGPGTKADEKDVEAVCSRSLKSRIFDLTDAIARKDCSRALKHLNDMLLLREPMQMVFYMITRQFRLMLEMKLYKAEGVSSDAAARKTGVNPYAAGIAMRQSGGFSADTLKKAVIDCLEMDASVKNGLIRERTALEMLIVKYSGISV